jgi:hypothetical protein
MEDSEELYIKVERGKAVGHPIMGLNLRMFYPNFDPENPPKGFERFTRSPRPEPSIFQKNVHTEYVKTNYGWTDKYVIDEVPITEIDTIYDKENNFPPKPDDGKDYFWADSVGKWINYQVFERVFGDFIRNNNINYEDINFNTFDGLTATQKKRFRELIQEYENIVNGKV